MSTRVGYTKQGNPVLDRRSEEATNKVGLNCSIFINYPLHHLLMNNGIWEPTQVPFFSYRIDRKGSSIRSASLSFILVCPAGYVLRGYPFCLRDFLRHIGMNNAQPVSAVPCCLTSCPRQSVHCWTFRLS